MKKAAMSLMVLVTMFALVYASAITYEVDKEGDSVSEERGYATVEWEKVEEESNNHKLVMWYVLCEGDGDLTCPDNP